MKATIVSVVGFFCLSIVSAFWAFILYASISATLVGYREGKGIDRRYLIIMIFSFLTLVCFISGMISLVQGSWQ